MRLKTFNLFSLLLRFAR